MTSSGMKRGLAVAAVSALALTGLPFLAGTANADPISSNLAVDEVALYSQSSSGASTENDGTNSSISLVASGGTDITSIQFQYLLPGGVDYIDIGAPVARNANGVFTTEWTPVDLGGVTVDVRAQASAGSGGGSDERSVTVLADASADTVELSSEGSLGVFQSPYTAGGEFVAVHGTTSAAGTGSIDDRSSATGATADFVSTGDTFGEGMGVLNIGGYVYSSGTAPNQIAIGADFGGTDDVEASTLYVQSITGATAVPATTNVTAGGNTDVTVTVTDQFGQPVAGASVGDTRNNTAPTAATDQGEQGITDANGQVVVSKGAGTYNFYVNKTVDVTQFNAGDTQAASFTIAEYIAAPASITISSDKNRQAFDIDELAGTANDFFATVVDQNGNPFDESVEYRWTVDPTGVAAATSTIWTPGLNTGADGVAEIPFPQASNSYVDPTPLTGALPSGAYTLEVRHPNVGGVGLMTATPMTYEVGESEITFADGDSAQTPVNGSGTFAGTLALVDGGSTLAGRTVTLSYDTTGDASFTIAQPSGTTRTSPTDATATTGANGAFSVTLNDPAVAFGSPVTPESGTLTATATALQGALGGIDSTDTAADASDSLLVNFAVLPVPDAVEVTLNTLIEGQRTPGRPVDLDVVVMDGTTELNDFPVTVTVDQGFLSPNADNEAALTPAATPAAGDLYGVWKNLGQSQDVSTGDTGVAGVVAAIEDNAGFDDDGLVTMNVTVTAGTITETRQITFTSANPLNPGAVRMEPIAGQPSGNVNTSDTVLFNVFTEDQFSNLVGGSQVNILDNSPVADFSTDLFGNVALSDFINDGASVQASSPAEATQVLTASWGAGTDTYSSPTSHGFGFTTVQDSTAPINWVTAPVGRHRIVATLKLSNNAKGNDVSFVNGPNAVDGANVRLYKFVNGRRVFIKSKAVNNFGNARFVIVDKNGRNTYTRYQARMGATPTTFYDWTPQRSIK